VSPGLESPSPARGVASAGGGGGIFSSGVLPEAIAIAVAATTAPIAAMSFLDFLFLPLRSLMLDFVFKSLLLDFVFKSLLLAFAFRSFVLGFAFRSFVLGFDVISLLCLLLRVMSSIRPCLSFLRKNQYRFTLDCDTKSSGGSSS
jgi:hypothetical protein